MVCKVIFVSNPTAVLMFRMCCVVIGVVTKKRKITSKIRETERLKIKEMIYKRHMMAPTKRLVQTNFEAGTSLVWCKL